MTMAADIAVSNSETLRVLDEFFHDIGLCRPNEAAGFAASTAALAARLLFAKGGRLDRWEHRLQRWVSRV